MCNKCDATVGTMNLSQMIVPRDKNDGRRAL